MAEATATIRNRDGIHCRPSVVIVKAMEGYPGQIRIANDMGETNLRSVMSLMTLGLRTGDSVSITVTGPDEDVTCHKIVELLETHFDFPPRTESEPPLPCT
jgi:phosphocarrier protein